MVAKKSLPDLVDAMEGAATTNHWDIVCSYGAQELNGFLKKAYDSGKLAQDVKISIDQVIPVVKIPITISYEIKFGSPLISFSAHSGTADLLMPILEGSSYTTSAPTVQQPPETVAIPGGTYFLKATVPLAVISGTTGRVFDQGSVITFSDDDDSHYSVIVHFKNTKGTVFVMQPPPAPDSTAELETYFLPAMSLYFRDHVSEIAYALTAVNNRKPAGGATVFTPKSFVFSSFVDVTDPNDAGSLSLYIQTEQSKSNPGSPVPVFHVGGAPLSPIPIGYSASIILANSLMVTAYLKPELDKQFNCTFGSPNSGIQVLLRKDVSMTVDAKSGLGGVGSYTYDGLSISLLDHPLTMTIQDGKCGYNWNVSARSQWGSAQLGRGAELGTVDLTIKMQKGPDKIRVNNSGLEFPPAIFEDKDFVIEKRAESCKWYQLGCREFVPPFYSTLKINIPPIDIRLPGFDYFLATNLLSPSGSMIDVDPAPGVATPHDFLIVGKTAAMPSAD